ncbi:unc-80 (predicted), partial [Pycnogonum litorale]
EVCECGGSSWHCSASVTSSDTKTSQHTSSSSSDGVDIGRSCTLNREESVCVLDVCLATYLDISVIRCLFIPQWIEDGVCWSLHYLNNRLQEIFNEQNIVVEKRKRSTSLPVPKIEVSFYQTPSLACRKDDLIKEPPAGCNSDSPHVRRNPSQVEKPHQKQKRIKIGDIKAFVDQKLRRSERQLEKSKEDSIGSSISAEDEVETGIMFSSRMSLDVKPLINNGKEAKYPFKQDGPPRPRSALASFNATEQNRPEYDSFDSKMIRVTEHSPIASTVEFFIKADSPETPPLEESPPVPTTQQSASNATATSSVMKDFSGSGGGVAVLAQNLTNNLTRSFTDSGIRYSVNDVQEACGSTHYVTKDGCMDYAVILQALHSVMMRDGLCSLRVCELIISIIELLISLGLLKNRNYLSDCKENIDNSPDGVFEKPLNADKPKVDKPKSDELSVHNMFMDTLFRVLKHLGCPHGCGEGYRGSQADNLRTNINHTLSLLHRSDSKQFRRFLRVIICSRNLSEILDFFHAFVGFCHEPSCASVSPIGLVHQKRMSGPMLVQTPSDGSGNSRNTLCGYSTNFGAGLGGQGPKGVEGVIVGFIFKPLVTRMVDCLKELRNPENMALYCDVRQLMTHIKEAHGGIFRRVLLSGLLDSADRPYKKDSQQITKVIRSSKQVEDDIGQHDSSRSHSPTTFFTIDETTSEKHSRKSIFRRRGVKKASSSQSILEDKDDMMVTCHSPIFGQSTGSLLRQHRSLTPRMSLCEDTGGVTDGSLPSPKRKQSRFPIVNWIKGDKSSDKSPALMYSERDEDTASIDRLPRRSSHINLKSSSTPKLMHKPSSSGQMGLSLMRARKRVEDHLNKYGFGRSKNKHGSIEDSLDQSRRNSVEYEQGEQQRSMMV